jgi:hypothetical protein
MNEFALATVAFSISFIGIGALGTYFRNIERPLFAEVLCWLSGTLTLAGLGVLTVVDVVVPDAILYTAPGVFVLGIVFNAAVLVVGIKAFERLQPIYGFDQIDYESPASVPEGQA